MDTSDSKKKNGGETERKGTAFWIDYVETRMGTRQERLPHIMDVGGNDLSLGQLILGRSLRPRGYKGIPIQTRLAPRSPRCQLCPDRLYLLCQYIYRVEHDEIIRIGGRWRNEECRPLDNQLDEASKGGKRRNGACEDDRETVSGLVPLSMNGDEEPEE